jgi:hypothetical protein
MKGPETNRELPSGWCNSVPIFHNDSLLELESDFLPDLIPDDLPDLIPIDGIIDDIIPIDVKDNKRVCVPF